MLHKEPKLNEDDSKLISITQCLPLSFLIFEDHLVEDLKVTLLCNIFNNFIEQSLFCYLKHLKYLMLLLEYSLLQMRVFIYSIVNQFKIFFHLNFFNLLLFCLEALEVNCQVVKIFFYRFVWSLSITALLYQFKANQMGIYIFVFQGVYLNYQIFLLI